MIARSTRCILTPLLIAMGACQSVTDAPPRKATTDSTRVDSTRNDTTVAPQIVSSIGLVVSDAVPLVGGASAVAGMVAPSTAADPGTVAYVSLLPGTVPGGVSATITNRRTRGTMVVAVVDGGFDPAVVSAARNDILDVVVSRSAGSPVELVTVVKRKPPRIVRTSPPRGATDVPIGAAALVVFSEPMDATTVTDVSVRLTVNGQRVPATVRLTQEGSVNAELITAAPLLLGTSYLLVIESSITNLAGDALEAAAAIPFVTQEPPPPAAVHSVFVTPQSLTIWAGEARQLLVVVQDAEFNLLTDRAVTWTSSNTNIASVSSTGVVTGASLGGTAVILATSEGKSGSANVSVTPAPTGSIAVVITTSGADVDPNGYLLGYNGDDPQGTTYMGGVTRINDSITVSFLPPGEKWLWLADVDPNCVVDSDVRNVTVANGTTTTARFNVNCVARPAFTDEGLAGVWRVEKFEFFRDSALTSRISDRASDFLGLILQRTPDGTFRWQWRMGPELPDTSSQLYYSGGPASVISDTLRSSPMDRWSARVECWELCAPFGSGGDWHSLPSRQLISRSGDQLVFTGLESNPGSGPTWPRLTLRKVR